MAGRITRPKWIRDKVRQQPQLARYRANVLHAVRLAREGASAERVAEAEGMVRWQQGNCLHAGCDLADLERIERQIREVAEGLPEGAVMPIKGLTDSVRAALPRLGKLRKGGPKDEARNKPGADLDYMRFTGEGPDAAAIEAAFAAAFGDEPKEIICHMPYATVEENFTTWKEAWAAGGLQHRCDGETCTVWLGQDGKYHREPRPCPGGCDEVGRLNVVVLALFEANFTGFVTVETHSVNDILNIQASLEAVAQLSSTHDLRGIPWLLRRVPEMVSTPGQGGKRVRRQKYMLKLLPKPEWASRLYLLDRENGGLPALGPGNARAADSDIITVTADGEIVDDDTTTTTDPPPSTPPAKPAAAVDPTPPAQAGPEMNEARWAALHTAFARDKMQRLEAPFVTVGKAAGWNFEQMKAQYKTAKAQYAHDPDGALDWWTTLAKGEEPEQAELFTAEGAA